MYVGNSAFGSVSDWLRGFEHAVRRLAPETPNELDGFREWLAMKFSGPGNTDWLGIICWKFGVGLEATDMMFQLLDSFLADVEQQGLLAIINSHADYERRRYGFLSTSRLGPNARPFRRPSSTA